MPRNGSGQYNLPYNWNDDKANGIKVLASRMQSQDQDIANALTGSLSSDGQTPLTGNLDFNGNKCVDLADGSSPADSVNVSQVQTGEFQFYGISTTTPLGTNGVNYDLGPTPAIDVYPDYSSFSFVCHFTCLDDPVMRFGTLSNKTLKKSNGSGGYTALKAGDMIANKEYFATLNNDVSLTDLIINNPELPIINAKNITEATTSVKGVSLLPKQIMISNNVSDPNNDLDFTAGTAQADDGSLVFSVAALTKRLDASWVAGNNQGGLDTGTKASNTPYYCFAIYNPTTLVSDILISASFTSPTLPSGYTKKRYIGSIGYTDSSSNIRPFIKQGNYTYYLNKNTPDYSVTNYGTSQVFVTLLTPPVSNITSYFAFDPAQINNATDRPFFCKTFSETNASPSGTTFDILMRAGTSNSSTPFWLPTTNGQIWYRASTATDGNSAMVIITKGWFDYNFV